MNSLTPMQEKKAISLRFNEDIDGYRIVWFEGQPIFCGYKGSKETIVCRL